MSLAPDMVDFFVSRRGTHEEVAQEVAAVLREAGYSVRVQDSDIAVADNFVAAMHDMLTQCRHFIAILTKDYLEAPFTKLEWTNFLAQAAESNGARRLIPLRVEDVKPTGLFAATVHADLVGVTDPARRRSIILQAATGGAKANGHKIFRGVPPANPHFIGRGALLDHLHGTFVNGAAPDPVTPIALQGLGGIGKSSLAAEYARRYAGAYAGVWWASAENRTVLIGSLAELASILDARLASTFLPQIATPTDLETLAKAGLAKLANGGRPWLLVYDNAESPEAIRELVPGAGARLLVTTRWPDWTGWALEVTVDTMTPEAAAEFLLKRTGRNDHDGAAKLAAALGYLPLALDHAGAYLRLTGTSFGRYADRLEELIATAPKGATYPASVGATFGLAIAKAVGECPAADTLLGFLSMLAPERIPTDIVDDSILAEDEREAALAALAGVSLIRHDPYPDAMPAVCVHRLVQAAARSRLAAADAGRSVLQLAIRRLSAAFPDNGYSEPRSWPRCKKLLPHALELWDKARLAGVEEPALALLLDGAANALHGRGAYAAAEPLLREAVSIGQRTLGPDHSDVGQWLNNLANIYMNTGRYAQAEPLYREAIEIGTSALGRSNYRVATRLSNLANLLMETGRYEDAEKLFREAIAIVEASLGEKHYMRAARLRSLASLLVRTGRAAEAEKLYREAIAIGEQTVGRENPHVSTWLGQLGNVCRDSGRHQEAEQLYREAIEHMVKAIGVAHPGVGGVRRELAALLLATGRAEEALDEANQAVSTQERAFGPDHDWTGAAAGILVASLAALGRAQEAAEARARYRLDRAPADKA